MSQDPKFKVGNLIRNSGTGETGIVKKLIYNSDGSIFAVIVKTRKGRQKWVVRNKKEKTIISKLLSLFSIFR